MRKTVQGLFFVAVGVAGTVLETFDAANHKRFNHEAQHP